METDTQKKHQQEDDISLVDEISYSLVVWNDEINTFDWVITSLIEVCRHTQQQAEQSAYIIHYHGKHAVKHGTKPLLEPMCNALSGRGIQATIEE